MGAGGHVAGRPEVEEEPRGWNRKWTILNLKQIKDTSEFRQGTKVNSKPQIFGSVSDHRPCIRVEMTIQVGGAREGQLFGLKILSLNFQQIIHQINFHFFL